MMPKDNSHTWPLFLEYRQCPSCQYILEDRTPKKDITKKFTCPRCGHPFTFTKEQTRSYSFFEGESGDEMIGSD